MFGPLGESCSDSSSLRRNLNLPRSVGTCRELPHMDAGVRSLLRVQELSLGRARRRASSCESGLFPLASGSSFQSSSHQSKLPLHTVNSRNHQTASGFPFQRISGPVRWHRHRRRNLLHAYSDRRWDRSGWPRDLETLCHDAAQHHGTDRCRCRDECQPTVLPPRGQREGHIGFCTALTITPTLPLCPAAHPCPVRDVDDQRQ